MSESLTTLNTIALLSNADQTKRNVSALTGTSSALAGNIIGLRALIASITNLGNLIINLAGVMIRLTGSKMFNSNVGGDFVKQQERISAAIIRDNAKLNEGSTEAKSDVSETMAGPMDAIIATFKQDLSGIGSSIIKTLNTGTTDNGSTGGALLGGLGKTAASPFVAMAKIGKGGFKAGASLMKTMGSTMKGMGPQMALLSLAIEPAMAMLNGILEPFGIFTDIFGLYGQILGQAFLPIIMQLVPVFMSFIPLIMSFAQIITALTPLMMTFLLPTMQLAGLLANFLTPAFLVLAEVINQLLAPITAAQDTFTNFTNSWNDSITAIMQPMYDAVEWMRSGGNIMGEFFGGIVDFFSNEGKYKSWWKA